MPRRFTVIINASSGQGRAEELRAALKSGLEDKGHTLTIVELNPGQGDITAIIRQAVEDASHRGDIVVAAGGDGTLSSLAALCHRHAVPMGIIPLGTFNYFAREHGIPVDIKDAIEVLDTGEKSPARIGMVGQHPFLVNASIGLYTAIIRNREEDKSIFGRHRIVAAFSAAVSLFKWVRVFDVGIDTPDGHIRRRTQMIFVGNNHLQMASLGLQGGEDNPPGTLDMVVMKPMTHWQTLRLLLLGILRRLKWEERLEEFTAPAFTVESRRAFVEAAIDGELVTLRPPLHFQALSAGLEIIRPRNQPDEAPT